MANSGSMKWCVLVVAFIALLVYQKQNKERTNVAPTVDSLEIDQNTIHQESDVYTGVPERAPVIDSLESFEPQDEMDMFDDSPLLEEPDVPFVENKPQQAITTDPELFEFDELESDSALESIPTKLPRPADDLEDDMITANPNGPMLDREIQLPGGVQTKVVQHIEYGKSLARRGAVFGAKTEFHSALRLIAQAIDYQMNTKQYSERLFDALVAMEEADDFYFAQGENNGRVDVATIGKRHRSRVIDEQQLADLTPVDAMQAYYNFVQEQFVASTGHTVVGGEALYCLGKLYLLKGQNVVEGSPIDSAKAIVHHRAAIGCDPQCYKSANELAVLLAKSGRLKQAKNLLIHSLKVKQVARAWENLAFVHQQLGEPQLSKLAFSEYQRMLNAPPTTKQIHWVSPEQFAATSKKPVEMRTAQRQVSVEPVQDKKKSSSLKNMLKRVF